MSSEQKAHEIAEKEKELKSMLTAHNVVEQEKLSTQREILVLQLKKKDLEIALDKSSHSIKQKNLEIKILTSEFWREKNQGR
jgi:hypothetical protein